MNYGYGFQHGDAAPDVADDQVIIENDEGWGMEVGGNFGCVHFTAMALVTKQNNNQGDKQ